MSNLTEAQANLLLDKLASDDAFRAQLQKDPVGAMASIGVKVDPATIPQSRTLPDKATVASNRDALRAKLAGQAGMGVFVLT